MSRKGEKISKGLKERNNSKGKRRRKRQKKTKQTKTKTKKEKGDIVQKLVWEPSIPLVIQLCLFAVLIHRGYYTVARRYEFYVRVARLTREILFLPQEHKIHIFKPTCNVLFIMWRKKFNKSKRRESWRHWTIRHSKVTYGNNATRVPDEVAYGIYEWFSSQ